MRDADFYAVCLEILIDKLGATGMQRFLQQCKPRYVDDAAVTWKLSKLDMAIIQKEVYQKHAAAQHGPENREKPSNRRIYQLGLKAISGKLGPAGLMRFLLIRKPGIGDYSVDKHKLPMPDIDTIVTEIQRTQELK